jgi:glutaminyl-tRNA synthetase
VVELRCSLDPESRSGGPGASRKVKGTIHWVSAAHGVGAEIRLYDRLFTIPNPLADKSRTFLDFLNPEALTVIRNAVVEPMVAEGSPGDCYQFERTGYFIHDSKDSRPGAPVLNRSVTLRDTWAKLEQQLGLKPRS